jgi:uncharacterized protein (DUF488 family)
METTTPDVICIESEAFYLLINKLVAYIKAEHGMHAEKWLSTEQAMKKLHITSKTSLQALRDRGMIAYTVPLSKKTILYDAQSIEEHLERNKKEKF